MDPRAIGLDRKKAGGDYLAAVERLGLCPTALFWAFDHEVGHFVLVLTTPVFDYAGPLELSRVLIEAYNRSGTPREVDPFVIRMHSPDHTLIREMAMFLPFRASFTVEHRGEELKLENFAFSVGGLEIVGDGIYRFDEPKPVKTIDAARRWRTFSTRVHSLAA